MNSRFAKTIAMIAGAHVLGGHWFAIQMVAWMGMFAANSQQHGLSAAFERTFDGEHPCALCCAVQAGQEEEKENQSKRLVDAVVKINAAPPAALELPAPLPSSLVFFPLSGSAASIRIQPPSPPPWRA